MFLALCRHSVHTNEEDKESALVDGKAHSLKYQETRAGSMLFLSNTYFMLGLTLWCLRTIYYFGRILLPI